MCRSDDILLMRLRNLQKGSVAQSQMPVDRCCKSSLYYGDKELKFSGEDDIVRIDCNISKKDFFQDYVQKRKPAVLKGCHEEWPARRWTFEGTLSI